MWGTEIVGKDMQALGVLLWPDLGLSFCWKKKNPIRDIRVFTPKAAFADICQDVPDTDAMPPIMEPIVTLTVRNRLQN